MFLMAWKKRESRYQENRGKDCSTSGCENLARVKGLCRNCYVLERYNKNKKRISQDNRGKECEIEDCYREAKTKGRCHNCYSRLRYWELKNEKAEKD